MCNILSHGGMDSIFSRPCCEFQQYSISKHMTTVTCKKLLFGMHTCMLYIQRLLASENLRPLSSHLYRFSPECVHVHKVSLDENGFVHIPQVSLGYAYGRILQGRISHHKYHLYILSSSCIWWGWGACTDCPKALSQIMDIYGFSLATVRTGLFDSDNVSLPLCAVSFVTRPWSEFDPQHNCRCVSLLRAS